MKAIAALCLAAGVLVLAGCQQSSTSPESSTNAPEMTPETNSEVNPETNSVMPSEASNNMAASEMTTNIPAPMDTSTPAVMDTNIPANGVMDTNAPVGANSVGSTNGPGR
jgi:cytoskeletal protein RodZ